MNGISTGRADTETLQRSSKRGLSLVEVIISLVIVVVIAALLLPNIRTAGPAARRTQCKNNLKQIVLALHNYHDEYHALPPAYTVDARGKRLHSWRALILPYLGQKELYKQIDFSKAWDDPANTKAFAANLPEYRCPATQCPPDHTTYLAVVTPNSCLRPAASSRLAEINSPSQTVVVIEVDSEHAVHWMAPSDANEELVLGLNSKSALPHSEGLLMAFADGSVQSMPADMSPAVRRGIISTAAADKEAVYAEAGEGSDR